MSVENKSDVPDEFTGFLGHTWRILHCTRWSFTCRNTVSLHVGSSAFITWAPYRRYSSALSPKNHSHHFAPIEQHPSFLCRKDASHVHRQKPGRILPIRRCRFRASNQESPPCCASGYPENTDAWSVWTQAWSRRPRLKYSHPELWSDLLKKMLGSPNRVHLFMFSGLPRFPNEGAG